MIYNRVWDVEVDGINYNVKFAHEGAFKENLYINGKEEYYEKGITSVITGLNISFKLGSKEVRLIKKGEILDLVVDGYFLDSGDEYIPKAKMPRWNFIFIFFCILLPILTLGGGLPIIMAIIGIYATYRISINPYIGSKKIVNSAIVVSIYLLTFLITIALSMLLYSYQS